jgi:hypothetical protein
MISFRSECSRLHVLEAFVGPMSERALHDFIELQSSLDSQLFNDLPDVGSDLIEFDREIDFLEEY